MGVLILKSAWVIYSFHQNRFFERPSGKRRTAFHVREEGTIMTPEQRFTRIENFLSTVAEHQAHMADQQARMSDHQASHDNDIRELREIQKSIGIAIMKLAEAHHATEEKLNALIETVDRIIRGQGFSPA